MLPFIGREPATSRAYSANRGGHSATPEALPKPKGESFAACEHLRSGIASPGQGLRSLEHHLRSLCWPCLNSPVFAEPTSIRGVRPRRVTPVTLPERTHPLDPPTDVRSGCMTPSPRLEVTDIRLLVGGSYGGLRVSLTGEGITARGLLTGEFGDQPLVGVVRRPGWPGDLVGTYWAGVYLVSEHFRRSITDLGATGWFTTPVPVEGIQSQLWLLSISGRCGPLFGVGGDPYPGGPNVGTFIDPARWDGADFFMAYNNNSIHFVGSTAERIHELRLSNVVLESAGLEPVRPE